MTDKKISSIKIKALLSQKKVKTIIFHTVIETILQIMSIKYFKNHSEILRKIEKKNHRLGSLFTHEKAIE